MRAVRRTEVGIGTVDVEEPSGPGVFITVTAAGICGSDLHMVELGPSPVTLGHEIAGTDEAGVPYAIDPAITCGDCHECRRGDMQLCTGERAILGVGTNGGMADRVAVPTACLVPLPKGLASSDACLVEPLAIAVHGWGLTDRESGMRVAVVGAGTIGLCAVAGATAGGLDVDLVARHPHQAEAGEQLGACIRVSDRYDIVVEAAGTPQALSQACEIVRPGGTVLVLGTHWGTMPVPGLLAVVKEIRFVCPVGSGHDGDTREIDVAATLLGTDPRIATTLVTHRFSLDDAAQAFRVAADRTSGAIKVVLEP